MRSPLHALRWTAAALPIFLCLDGAAWAQAVTNPGFEGGSTGGAPTGWTLYNPGYSYPSCGTIYPFQTCFGWALIPPPGTGNSSATCLKLDQDWASQAQGVWQETTAVFSANSSYLFKLKAKKAFDPSGTYLVMEIGYRSGASFVSLTGTVLAGYVEDATPEWRQYSVPYTSGASGPELGKKVAILARNTTYRSGLCIDDAELIFPTPIAIAETGESTSVSEIGPTSDTYSIVLRHQPAAAVNITVDPDAQVQVNGAGAGNPVVLNFTTGNWSNPQIVTVTAAPDAVPEGYHSAIITHTSSSSDPEFDGIALDQLRVIVYEEPFVGHGVFHDMNYRIPEYDISGPGDPHHSLWESKPGHNYEVGMTHPAVSEAGALYILHHRSAPPADDLPRNRLKRSTDGGYTWIELSYAQISMSGLNTLLIGTAFGQEKLFNTGLSKYSPDAAANWYPFTYENGIDPYWTLYGEPPTHLITLPGTDTLFLTTDQINDWPHIGTMYSTDGGLNWFHGGNLPGHPTMDQFQLPVTIISPDQQRLMVLAGTHGRYSADGIYRLSHMWQTLDDDLGIWSAPESASAAVAGDRAFASYARDGRLVLGFRDTTTKFVDGVVWVGTYDDLIHGRDGQYRIFCVEREIDWYGGMVVRRQTPPAPDEFLFFTHNEMVRFTLEEFDALFPGSCKIHLPLDESSGTVASDTFMASKTGPNISGVVSGASWTAGRLGNCLTFDGIDGYVTVDPDGWDGLDIGARSASISFWVKTANPNQSATLLGKGAASVGAAGWAVVLDGGLVQFRLKDVANGSASVCSMLPADGQWHHVVGILDRAGSSLALHLDGVLGNSLSPVDLGNVSSAVDLELARSTAGSGYFAGSLDDVRFFDYALSASEQQHYSSVNLSTPGNLLRNGDFEAGPDFTTLEGYPLYWKHYGDNPSWLFTKPPGTGNPSARCVDLYAGATGYPTGAGFYQETDAVFVPNATYRFDLDMVLFRETPSTIAEMSIGYFNTFGAFQTLASSQYEVFTGTAWNTYSVSYATGAAGASLGRKIVVRFKNVNHREHLHCDNAVLKGPGIVISESGSLTAVTEGAGSDGYTVALNSQPLSTVTVTVDPDAQCQINGTGPGNPVNLVFTNSNWNAPQPVTVSAVNDSTSEGFHTSTITHAASSSHLAYAGMTRSLIVKIIDDDMESCCLGPDCNGNSIPDQCDIAAGTSLDCNGNGIPDSCDIAGATSQDNNFNGVPDECEVCPGDLDHDGDVDLTDFGQFQRCYGPSPGPECVEANLGGTGTIDQTDVILFIQCLSCANRPCDPDCDQ